MTISYFKIDMHANDSIEMEHQQKEHQKMRKSQFTNQGPLKVSDQQRLLMQYVCKLL